MGVKRGTYQTKKQLLQNQCAERGIKFAVRWGTQELQACLDGNRKPASIKKSNTNRPKPQTHCLPIACTCGKPVNLKQTEEIRRAPRMHQKTNTHHFDGVIFAGYKCECGQNLVVKIPIKSRSVKCVCKRPAVLWDKDGVGKCAGCAS